MKKTTLFLAFIFIASGFVFSQYSDEYYYQKKQAYKEFIKNHEYSNRPAYSKKELKSIPKKDRPDLANEQNFLQTLDPNLGYVPKNALINAHKITDIYTQQNKTAIPGIVWTERGPNNFGGRTRALIWDPNDPSGTTVIAGGVAGGLWVNTNITSAASQWVAINDFWDNLAVTALAYDPSNTLTMYAGTGEGFYNIDAVAGGGIWKSTNGGSSWSRLGSTSIYNYITKIVVASNGDVYATTNGSGVIRSTNGGTSWAKVLGSGMGASTNRAADIEIGADGTLYAALGIFSTDGIYSSTNGTSWTKLNTGANGFPTSNINRIEIACAPSNANTIYAIVQDGGTNINGIYKSTNKGSSWSSLSLPNDADGGVSPDFTRGQAWYDLSIDVDPNNANNVFVGGIDLFKSTNGGSSWSQVSHWYGGFGFQEVHADQHIAKYKPGSSTQILFGHDGGVSYSSNANAAMPTISARNNGYNVTQFYAAAINGSAGSNNMIAGAQDNGTHKFTSAGVNSTSEVTGGDGAFCHIDQSNGNNQISQYVRNVVYRTTNNWSSSSQINNSQSTGLFINPSEYDDKEDIYYSGHSNGSLIRLLRKTDPFGSATSGTVVIASGSSDVSHISASPYSSGGNSTLFVGTDGGDVYKVTNAQSGSPSVTNIGGSLPAGNISCIAIGASEQQLLVTLSNYGVVSVWETLNGGSSWTDKEGNLPNMPVRWALYNPLDFNEVFLATEVGVWSTDDLSAGSVDWSPTNNGLANVRTDMLQYRASDNTIVAATHGRGLFTTIIPAASAPVADFSGTPTTLCEGATVSFTDLSTNTPTSWSWSFPGGTPSTSTAQNPTVTYNTAGTYNVTLTATNASGSDPETKVGYITVNAAPGSAGTISGSNTVCENATGIGYSISAVSGATNYNWTVPSGATITGGQGTTSITVSFGTNSGNVSVTPSNSCGNGGSNNLAVTVNNCPSLPTTELHNISCNQTLANSYDIIYAKPITSASHYIFNVSNVILSYNHTKTAWAGGRAIRMDQFPGIQLNTTYDVKVKVVIANDTSDYGTICQVTTANSFSPNPLPTSSLLNSQCGATFNSLSDIMYAKPVSGATNYIFNVSSTIPPFNFTKTAWAGGRAIRLNQITGIQLNTTYDVKIKVVINGDTSLYGNICQITTPSTLRLGNPEENGNNYDINENTSLTDLVVYPNPNQGDFVYIDLNGFEANAELFIIDISGKIIQQQAIDSSVSTIRFNEKLKAGFYFITVVSENNKITKKLVVK